MKRLAWVAMAAVALGGAAASEARENGRLVRCRVESARQVEISGRCRFIADTDGSFTLESAEGEKPLFGEILDVSVSIVGPDAAEVRGLTRSGVNSRWGEARRSAQDRACWVGADFRICAY